MFPPKSPDDLWSSSRFTRRIPDFSPEREDEIAALFTRSHMSSAARSSIGPSLNFTELVMARVHEEAQLELNMIHVW